MERLTQYNEELEEIDFLIDNVSERGAYTIVDLVKHRKSNSDFDDFLFKVAQKLKDYEDLEEQGLLLKLPCKVGDTIWYLQEQYVGKMIAKPVTVSSIQFDRFLRVYGIEERQNTQAFWKDDFGKTVFLTQAEAEEALRKMNETEE